MSDHAEELRIIMTNLDVNYGHLCDFTKDMFTLVGGEWLIEGMEPEAWVEYTFND